MGFPVRVIDTSCKPLLWSAATHRVLVGRKMVRKPLEAGVVQPFCMVPALDHAR